MARLPNLPLLVVGVAAAASAAAQPSTSLTGTGQAFVRTNCCSAETYQADVSEDPVSGTKTGALGGARDGSGQILDCDGGSESVMQSASLDGSATAAYCQLAGGSHASAANAPEQIPCSAGAQLNELDSYGRAGQTLGFYDVVTVSSPVLANGTPVSLEFTASLDSTASFYGTGAGPWPASAGAAMTGSVVGTGLNVPELGFNSGTPGYQEGSREFVAAVGDAIAIQGYMTLDVAAATGLGAAASEANLSAVARFYLSSTSPGVTLPSDSGHDYTVPEPPHAELFGVATVLSLALRRRAG
jgi:hypothetical protein